MFTGDIWIICVCLASVCYVWWYVSLEAGEFPRTGEWVWSILICDFWYDDDDDDDDNILLYISIYIYIFIVIYLYYLIIVSTIFMFVTIFVFLLLIIMVPSAANTIGEDGWTKNTHTHTRRNLRCLDMCFTKSSYYYGWLFYRCDGCTC